MPRQEQVKQICRKGKRNQLGLAGSKRALCCIRLRGLDVIDLIESNLD
jgi:hypothetical protein